MSTRPDSNDPSPDPFEHDDAAYLLGSLDATDRAAFEAHLAACDDCAARVAALRPVVRLLETAGVGAIEALDQPGRPPSGLPPSSPIPSDGARPRGAFPDLLEAIERSRRRRRWVTAGLAGIAAAAIAALVVVLTVPTGNQQASQPMATLSASPVQATAALTERDWGTEIRIDCRYADTDAYGSGNTYTLRVIDAAGHSHELGSWSLPAGSQATFTSGTSLPLPRIRYVQVVGPAGNPVLQLPG